MLNYRNVFLKMFADSRMLNCQPVLIMIFRDIPNDQTILLLYLMLHQNEAFMSHMLKRDDLGNLVRTQLIPSILISSVILCVFQFLFYCSCNLLFF